MEEAEEEEEEQERGGGGRLIQDLNEWQELRCGEILNDSRRNECAGNELKQVVLVNRAL